MVEKFLRKHYCLVAVICLLFSLFLFIVFEGIIKSPIMSWILRIVLACISIKIIIMIVTFLLLKKLISKEWYEVTWSKEEYLNASYLTTLFVDTMELSNIKMHMTMDKFNVINIRFIDKENKIIYATYTDKYKDIYCLIEDAKIEKI
ncbi:MAG: hypothetical protein HFJ40_02745 [Clostridia bacterium]|nr:hypothetical protein [Clostridia bacterium]